MNPEHPTGNWSLEQCRSTLELKTMHRVTSGAEVAKIVEFILHCEHFERDGSLGYIATMLSGDGPWPARTTASCEQRAELALPPPLRTHLSPSPSCR